jgi:hypothetical protein
MIPDVHRWRRLAGLAWVLLSGFLALIAVADLVASVIDIFDPDELRNTAALVVIAVVGAAAALASLTFAVRWRRGRRGRGDVLLGMNVTTLLLIALYNVAVLASGRL